MGAVLTVVLLAACSDDGGSGTPSPSPSASSAPAETSPAADPSASDGTVDPADVTDEQKKACLDAMVKQLGEKKGGSMPQECAILPRDVVTELIQQALSGG